MSEIRDGIIPEIDFDQIITFEMDNLYIKFVRLGSSLVVFIPIWSPLIDDAPCWIEDTFKAVGRIRVYEGFRPNSEPATRDIFRRLWVDLLTFRYKRRLEAIHQAIPSEETTTRT